jgi:hypothetical protein
MRKNMILRTLAVMLALGSGLASPLFAGAERGSHLFIEAGGIPGVAGIAGIPGIPGVAGIPGGAAAFAFADFFSLNPPTAQIVAAGNPVAFPNQGPNSGAIISNVGGTQFTLPDIGTYQVEFQVSVTEGTSQLQLSINGAPDANTVVARAAGTDQIIGVFYVTTGAPGTLLEVINPAGNANLTVTPLAGGVNPSSIHLLITRIR